MKAYVINLDSRPDRMKLFLENKIPFEVERYSAILMPKGEDGCTASHMDLLSKQTEFPFIIFEDDCWLIEDWSIVEKAMNILGGHFDSDSYASSIPAIIIYVVASDLGGFSITPESHINNTERYAPNNMKYELGLNFTDGTKDRIVKKNLSLAEVFKYVKLYL